MDFGAVYALVVDFTKILFITLVCISNSWSVQHVDAKAAFLNGDIDRNVFVYHLYNLPYKSRRGTIYKHHKALYGLHQAPLQWLLKLTEYLIQRAKFQLICSYIAVFIRQTDGSSVFILAYVDDLLFFGITLELLHAAIADFLKTFWWGRWTPLMVPQSTSQDQCWLYLAFLIILHSTSPQRVWTIKHENFFYFNNCKFSWRGNISWTRSCTWWIESS